MAKKERKKTISPAGNWPAALMKVDMPTKIATEATFSAMPVSVLVRRSRRRRLADGHDLRISASSSGTSACPIPLLPQASDFASWMAFQMRAGVAGMSMWPMP